MTVVDLAAPDELHPAAIEAAKLYVWGKRVLDRRALSKIESRLAALADELRELLSALSSLGALALYLRGNGDAVAADALERLIRQQAQRYRGQRSEP